MPRNSSGIYTLPGGNPVTPGNVIEASWANTTLEDVADALTNSLSRTGAGGMLAPFRIADGSISAPGLSYLNETNTGLYRSGSGSTWMAVLGVNVAQFSTVGLTIPFGKALTAQGNASVSGTFAVTGAATFGSTLALTGALTATGGVVGNVTGNVTATSGTSTFNDMVVTGSLDMTAGSSATITGLNAPVNASDAANKGYVDAQVATRLALTGGTMSGAIAMGSSKITGLATPTADADAATKAYVDSVAQGLDVKGSCRAATTGNITLSGAQTIDGVAIIAGDRVLVKDQSTAANNGIYVAASGSWARAADADTWAKLVGAFTFVEEGTVNDNSGWVCTSPAGGTLGVTAVTWEQFSGAGQITAGAGMYKTGNTLNVGTASSSRIVVNTDDIDLATTGVTASTYKSVTVDAYGRVTAGTNPTTLAGFGITNAYTKTEVDALDALKLNLTGGTMSGVIAMGANKITGLADPTLAQDAATKNYIDTIFGSTTSAAASAAAAASSASSASSSATAAASSATAAAGSATSAASSYTTFNNQYLGSKSSDPATNNTGGALVTGNLYWNSTSSVMKVYDGSAWSIAYVPSGTYLALTGGTLTGNLGFNGTGLRITGDFTNATGNSRLLLQSSTANGFTNVGAIPNGTSAQSAFEVYGASDTTNTAIGRLIINATQVSLRSVISGTGAYLPLTFWSGGSERFRLNETTGNFLIGTLTDDGANKLQVTGNTALTGNLSVSGTATLSGGTANGVTYLNGSKVLTSGSALTFDGSTLKAGSYLGVATTTFETGSRLAIQTSSGKFDVAAYGGSSVQVMSNAALAYYVPSSSYDHIWLQGAGELMRLTSTGLGIGTSSPAYKLDVVGNARVQQSNFVDVVLRLSQGASTTGNQSQILFQDQGTNTTASITAYGSAYGSGVSGALRFGTVGGAAIIDSSGNLLINRTSRLNNGKVEALASVSEQAFVAQVQSNGNSVFQGFNASGVVCFQATGSGGLYISGLGTGTVYSSSGNLTNTNPSDARLKNDIAPIAWGLEQVLALRPVSYKWKTDTVNQGVQYGFIAQEVQPVMPDLVREFKTKDGDDIVTRLGLERDGIFVAMVKAIQEQQALITQLQARLDAANF